MACYHRRTRICAHRSRGVRSPRVFLTADCTVAALFAFNWSSSGTTLAREDYLLAACLPPTFWWKACNNDNLWVRLWYFCTKEQNISFDEKDEKSYWLIANIRVTFTGLKWGLWWRKFVPYKTSNRNVRLHLLALFFCLRCAAATISHTTANKPCTQQEGACHSRQKPQCSVVG